MRFSEEQNITYFWLSDGFQRVAAAELVGLTELLAESRDGTLRDAQWDSHAANATHCLRRTVEETKRIVLLAMEHPNSNALSNVELAKHVHLPEATFRRWRKRLSSSTNDDAVRQVRRGKTTYQLKTSTIGKNSDGRSRRSVKSRHSLRVEMENMKIEASSRARRLLTILGNWAFGGAIHSECLDAIERVLRECETSSAFQHPGIRS